MTRRVIQTDLFAAFKESQKRAEEQLGHKRKIRVEGTSVRKEAEEEVFSDPPSSSSKFEVVQNLQTAEKNRSSTLEETPEPTQETSQTAQAPSAEPSTPTVESHTAPQNQRVTIPYQKPRQQPVEAAPAGASTQKQPEAVAPRAKISSPPSNPSDGSGTLLMIALVIVTAAAAFVVGQKTTESEVVTVEKPIYITPEAKPLAEPISEDNSEITPIEKPTEVIPQETEATTVVPSIQETENASPTSETPQPVGRFSIMMVSGIDPNQAHKVAKLIEDLSDYPVYIREYGQYAAVYVGRFAEFNSADAKKCQDFCRHFEFEGRQQFQDAFRTNLPKVLLD